MKKISTSGKTEEKYSESKADHWIGPGRSLKLVLGCGRSGEVLLETKSEHDPEGHTMDGFRSDVNTEALRALVDSGAKFTETEILRFSSNPRSDSDLQDIAEEGLARLKTPAACAC